MLFCGTYPFPNDHRPPPIKMHEVVKAKVEKLFNP